MIVNRTLVRVACRPVAIAGFALMATTARADMPQIVVEAKAPVHAEKAANTSPGGAQVDMLSVQYHVHMDGLDLSKTADVARLQDQIKVAAQKACKTIQDQYPDRSLSDEQSCVKEATGRGMAQAKNAIAAAAKTGK